jgi:hypothetical protein
VLSPEGLERPCAPAAASTTATAATIATTGGGAVQQRDHERAARLWPRDATRGVPECWLLLEYCEPEFKI